MQRGRPGPLRQVQHLSTRRAISSAQRADASRANQAACERLAHVRGREITCSADRDLRHVDVLSGEPLMMSLCEPPGKREARWSCWQTCGPHNERKLPRAF